MRHSRTLHLLCGLTLAIAVLSGVLRAQQMDLRQASGVPLPSADLPVGTVSVRVVRDSFANSLSGVDVEFEVNGQRSTSKTDTSGRAQLDGLAAGTTVRARATVDGQTFETQPVTLGESGVRFVLVTGTAPAPAGTAVVPGAVVFGSESRFVAEFADERLNIYYVLQIVNNGSTPVDPGGPIVIELPTGARSATVLQGSTAKATANGPHVTVTAPFAPGVSELKLAYELPMNNGSATLRQTWPLDMPRTTFFALKSDQMRAQSRLFTNVQDTVQEGQPLIIGTLTALPKGQVLEITIDGLPHHPTWPRNTALVLGGGLTLAGIVGAMLPTSRRRRA
jgi:hypothetical protein